MLLLGYKSGVTSEKLHYEWMRLLAEVLVHRHNEPRFAHGPSENVDVCHSGIDVAHMQNI